MKKLLQILIIGTIILSFSACKTNKPYVVDAEGNIYDAVLTADGDKVQSANGTLMVIVKDEHKRDVTNLSGKYLIVNGGKIMGNAFDITVTDKFSIESTQNADLTLVSNDNKITLIITDKTESVNSFDDLVSATYKSLQSKSDNISEPVDISAGETTAKRFCGTIKNHKGDKLQQYTYLLQADNRILMITLTADESRLSTPEEADSFIEENISFTGQQ